MGSERSDDGGTRRVIHKPPPTGPVVPNLVDYDATRASFTWAEAEGWLSHLPDGGGLNIAHEAVRRHAHGPRADRVALRFLGEDDSVTDLTYTQLDEQVSRFANALAGLGVEPGDRVFSLCGRRPELYVTVLGTLAHRAVFCPLFSSFGPEPVHQRLTRGDGRVLVTTASLYRKRIAALRDRLPDLEHVLLVDATAEEAAAAEGSGVHALGPLLAGASPDHEIGPTDPESPALLHFTSGTTGNPKGALHVHRAVVAHHATGRFALDLHPDDVFWCTADPGWVTGTSYGILSPLTHGITTVVDTAEFDARRWYRILEEQRVTVWYTAPTAIRMLMREGPDLTHERDLSSVRFVASVGEPLNPEAVVWGADVLGLPIHDNWWQTETGGIMVANYAACDIRPGSMGRPIPGIDAAVVAVDDENEPILEPDGSVRILTEPGAEGVLALRRGWPSMFRGYLHEEERYAKCFVGDWYLSGDLVSRDEDGWYWFVGRGDDVIKTAGHLVGPFELESVFMEHPAVAEAAVIGLPDPVAGNVLKAFVTLAGGVAESDELRRELLGFGRKRLGAIAPREVAFATDLPKTRSGKIMRRLLRARELGLPEGDLSTLEPSRGAAGAEAAREGER
jgi:acetyl-CoA synthetase